MRHKLILIFVFCLLIIGTIYGYYYHSWKYLWVVENPISFYDIPEKNDDTLRVLMIGDSWVGIHNELQMDTFLCLELEKRISCPVKVVSKGKGGEKSRGIYQLMFQTEGYGTKTLFLAGVDYCIVSAGINDAAANLGTKQFCAHYRMILDFLIAKGIRPVIIEIPDVDIWNIYGDKPPKDLLADFLRSTMTRCWMYHFHEYREALNAMLQNQNLMSRVVIVPMTTWNGEGVKQNPSLFLADKIHLNLEGYEKLDECIAKAIACDLQQVQDTAIVYQSMYKDAE